MNLETVHSVVWQLSMLWTVCDLLIGFRPTCMSSSLRSRHTRAHSLKWKRANQMLLLQSLLRRLRKPIPMRLIWIWMMTTKRTPSPRQNQRSKRASLKPKRLKKHPTKYQRSLGHNFPHLSLVHSLRRHLVNPYRLASRTRRSDSLLSISAYRDDIFYSSVKSNLLTQKQALNILQLKSRQDGDYSTTQSGLQLLESSMIPWSSVTGMHKHRLIRAKSIICPLSRRRENGSKEMLLRLES